MNNMPRRSIGETGLEISEVGFGVWTIASGWWGKYTEDEAVKLIRDAYDRGINFFNTSNAYGEDAYGEKLVAKALADVRDNVVIATTVGYDLEAPRAAGHGGHSERPHDWSEDNIKRSLENSLKALDTDHIDMWQLHNPRMDAFTNDALWNLLDELKREKVVTAIGPSIGPAIGWRDEGMFALENRDIDFFHHIHNMLEQQPGNDFNEAAAERGIATLIRVPHSSGLLEDKYDENTTFDANDHRSHRKKEWLTEGLQKIETLRFLLEDREGATMGQIAIKWLLSDPIVATVQPNIYDLEQIDDFVASVNIEELDADELGEINQLFKLNFGVELAGANA